MLPPLAPAVGAVAGRSAIITTDPEGILSILAMFGVGLYLVYDGFAKWQQYRLMQDTPTERIPSAAAGRTEIEGTARDGYGTVVQPFTGGECLLAEYEIEEYRSDDDGGHWATVASGTLSVPFLVDDGTGTMRVEPVDDATFGISDEHRTQLEIDGDDVEPEAVQSFVRTYTDLDVQTRGGFSGMLFDDQRRYTQYIIPVGASVYVLGGSTPRNQSDGVASSSLVMGRDEGSGQFIIADRSEEELVARYKWLAPAQMLGGLALSAVMLYFLLV
jgi:hypothetical protein